MSMKNKTKQYLLHKGIISNKPKRIYMPQYFLEKKFVLTVIACGSFVLQDKGFI